MADEELCERVFLRITGQAGSYSCCVSPLTGGGRDFLAGGGDAAGCALKWCQGFWALVNLGDSQSCLALTQRCPRQVQALSPPVSSAGSCRDL